MKTGSRASYFDWIDALLFALGFVLVIAALAATSGFAVGAYRFVWFALLAAPSALRRKLFGAPQLAQPTSGALWSLLSILGLLAVMVGIGVLALATVITTERIAELGEWWASFEPFAAGIVMVLFGALCLRARYPRVRPIIPPAHVHE